MKFGERIASYVKRWMLFIALMSVACIIAWAFVTFCYFLHRIIF